jgi:hypothetical protein
MEGILAMDSTVKSKQKIIRRYSPLETKLLTLLSEEKVITSKKLTEDLYSGNDIPFHAQSSVTSILRALIRKVEHNGESFIITKTRPIGPYPVQYQKVPKFKKS